MKETILMLLAVAAMVAAVFFDDYAISTVLLCVFVIIRSVSKLIEN